MFAPDSSFPIFALVHDPLLPPMPDSSATHPLVFFKGFDTMRNDAGGVGCSFDGEKGWGERPLTGNRDDFTDGLHGFSVCSEDFNGFQSFYNLKF